MAEAGPSADASSIAGAARLSARELLGVVYSPLIGRWFLV
jgi:hypothetical protein